ncbi:hypothetical protein ACROYT_G011468 [Oculina patagonica]
MGGTSDVDFSYSQKCSGEFGSTAPPIHPGKETKKKPAKYVPLYGAEGQARSSVRLPGRHPCECLGQKHSLVNNCTECGRIVCMQEGSGPCFFCGALVCTKEEQEILARNSKKSQKLYQKLLTQTIEGDTGAKTEPSAADEGLQKAIAHKNRLIEYDKSGVRRTKGRKVIDESKPEVDYSNNSDAAVLASGYYSSDKKPQQQRVSNPNFPNVTSLKFVSSTKGANEPQSFKSAVEKQHGKEVLRIQDKEFQEMSDTGACLSMHQPWASLLVQGIKKVEGRTWYTPHRGRLWIAAAAKQPTEQEIAAVEGMYRALYGNENIAFPKQYPVSCLLGCVDLVDCLAQEDYKEEFPEGESESPYVFVCENPQQLTVKFPVKGQHKIWKLESCNPQGCQRRAQESCVKEPLKVNILVFFIICRMVISWSKSSSDSLKIMSK